MTVSKDGQTTGMGPKNDRGWWPEQLIATRDSRRQTKTSRSLRQGGLLWDWDPFLVGFRVMSFWGVLEQSLSLGLLKLFRLKWSSPGPEGHQCKRWVGKNRNVGGKDRGQLKRGGSGVFIYLGTTINSLLFFSIIKTILFGNIQKSLHIDTQGVWKRIRWKKRKKIFIIHDIKIRVCVIYNIYKLKKYIYLYLQNFSWYKTQ